MERRELRHDRHTVTLSTDHTVFSPKYRGKILAGVVALALDGSIRKTCKDPNIEIIDMAVNVDHVHLFVKYPPKCSVNYIYKRIKGRSSRELPKSISTPQGIVRVLVSGHHPVFMATVRSWVGVVERYIQNQEKPNAKSQRTSLILNVLKCGV